jgi:hypothetical protein
MKTFERITSWWGQVDWKKQQDDWINSNTILSVLIYSAVAYSCINFLTVGFERAKIQAAFRPILSLLVTFLPGLVIVLAFAAYRSFYRGSSEGRRSDRRIVTWRRYSIPLMILMSITTIFLAAFLYEDLDYSTRIYTGGGFAFGVFVFPLHYGETKLSIPSTIFWAGYVGYLISLMGITLRRMTTNNLVPHFYIASSYGLLKSLVAAVLIFLMLDALPGLFKADGVSFTDGVNPSLAILIAFTAGATADDVIKWVIGKIRRIFGRNVPDPLPLALVQGIDPTMEAFLHDEGIDSIQALATVPIGHVAQKVGIPEETVRDWQSQAGFLRNFTSSELAEHFHRIGINEVKDLKDLDNSEITKALAALVESDDLGKEEVNKVLVKVLRSEIGSNQ